MTEFKEFFDSYLATLLWSSGENFDHLTIYDFNQGDKRQLFEEAEVFFEKYWPLVEIENQSYAQFGHDFALTRNGHGAGFWDGDWPEYGDTLTKACEEVGEVDVYELFPDDEIVWRPE